jgi:hypothetical protein
LPYEKPRLQAVTLANEGGKPLKMRSELEIGRRLAFVLELIARGEVKAKMPDQAKWASLMPVDDLGTNLPNAVSDLSLNPVVLNVSCANAMHEAAPWTTTTQKLAPPLGEMSQQGHAGARPPSSSQKTLHTKHGCARGLPLETDGSPPSS